jgi:hypothetical protein
MRQWILFLVFGLVNDIIYMLMTEGIIRSEPGHRTVHYFGSKIMYVCAVVSAFQSTLP